MQHVYTQALNYWRAFRQYSECFCLVLMISLTCRPALVCSHTAPPPHVPGQTHRLIEVTWGPPLLIPSATETNKSKYKVKSERTFVTKLGMFVCVCVVVCVWSVFVLVLSSVLVLCCWCLSWEC